jgi:hypothetical protein
MDLKDEKYPYAGIVHDHLKFFITAILIIGLSSCIPGGQNNMRRSAHKTDTTITDCDIAFSHFMHTTNLDKDMVRAINYVRITHLPPDTVVISLLKMDKDNVQKLNPLINLKLINGSNKLYDVTYTGMNDTTYPVKFDKGDLENLKMSNCLEAGERALFGVWAND